MWYRVNVVFTLKSPLHIGYLPFRGPVISPTRYYVPGRNFWGAITKRATENLYEKPVKEYEEIGKQVKGIFRFSYFYLYDGKTIFMPQYSEEGLLFGDKKQIDKFQFEYRFIGSRVLIAINSDSGTAKYESLHEIEFIKDKFSDDEDRIKDTKIIGCIWVKENSKIEDYEVQIKNNGIFVNNFNLIEELTLGGEQGYGFGSVKLESISDNKAFLIRDIPDGEEINIITKEDEPILSHLKYDERVPFRGEIELLTGRGYLDIDGENREKSEYKKSAGGKLARLGYYFSPGTFVNLENDKRPLLGWNGVLIP